MQIIKPLDGTAKSFWQTLIDLNLGCERFLFSTRIVAITVVVLSSFAFSSETWARQLLSTPTNVSPQAKAIVEQLLEDQWSSGESKNAVETFAKMKSDPSVSLAFAINQFRFGDKESALQVTSEMTRQIPENLDAQMLTLWFGALLNQYDQSLIGIGKMHEEVKQQAGLPEENKLAIYRRMGKLVGYFKGPVLDHVNEDLLVATQNKLEAELVANLKTAFLEGQAEVMKAYQDLERSQAETNQQELVEIGIQNEEELKRLNVESERLLQTESQLTPQRDSINAEGIANVSRIEQQGQLVTAQLTGVNQTIFAVERDLGVLYSEWNYNHSIDYHGNDFFLQTRIRDLEYSLAQARNTAFSLSSQLASIRGELQATRSHYNARIAGVDAEIARAKRDRSRVEVRIRRLARGPEIATGKLSGRMSRRVSLKTYDDLSLELLRQQFLDAIK